MRKRTTSSLLVFVAFTLPVMALADYATLKPEKNQAKISSEVSEQLQENHYNRVDLDDAFSAQILNGYLDELDGNRSIFLASDIEKFKKQYADQLDDQIKESKLDADFEIYNTYQKRRIEIDEWLLKKVKAGVDKLDLTNDESVHIDRSEMAWPANEKTRRALWAQLLESQVIDMRLSDMEMEEVQKRLTQRYTNELNWLRQVEPTDAFSTYMSAYAHSYDPHTDYLSPRQSEELNISLNLSLRGIGAELRSVNGTAEVVRVIPGGPAAKAGELRPTDQIIAVAQGKKGEFTDVVGLRLDDTVRLIRGEIGSVVRLQIQPANGGELETISITRDEVELKDQAASKKIIPIERDGKTVKIGLVRLATFYNGTASDVRKLLEELNEENVAGVVMDLRNNGGGSLEEVVKLVGLFMGPVPAVQIRDANGSVALQGDRSAKPVFSGPLSVMVNRLSASASEIFAAAMQDYGRGIIVGSATFGKGTVQAVMPLDRKGKKGLITLTQAKFYRVSGDSTQRHGVTPDLEFPSFIDPEQIGEEILPHALPWDQIDPIDYPSADFIERALPSLQTSHDSRIKDDADFQYLAERIGLARERSQQKDVSLVLKQRQQEQKTLQQKRLTLVNKYRQATGEKPFKDFAAFKESEDKKTPEDDLSPLVTADSDETDGYQKEAANILIDIMQLFGRQV